LDKFLKIFPENARPILRSISIALLVLPAGGSEISYKEALLNARHQGSTEASSYVTSRFLAPAAPRGLETEAGAALAAEADPQIGEELTCHWNAQQ
jgi:hypothetical protein